MTTLRRVAEALRLRDSSLMESQDWVPSLAPILEGQSFTRTKNREKMLSTFVSWMQH